MLTEVAKNATLLYDNIGTLEDLLSATQVIDSGALDQAKAYREKVFTQMSKVRNASDTLETLIPCDIWPIPTYLDLLFKL